MLAEVYTQLLRVSVNRRYYEGAEPLARLGRLAAVGGRKSSEDYYDDIRLAGAGVALDKSEPARYTGYSTDGIRLGAR